MMLRRLHTVVSRFKISDEITQAIKENMPVVALESAIITHGMPYPYNYDTAVQVEDIVRQYGGIPATVGIINGVVKIGLCKEEIAQLSDLKNSHKTVKTSRRDLPIVTSKLLSGGTTVSATIIAAKYAGIKLFVTGGIGGVHRGGQDTFDISADLIELGRNSITVVCGGVKSILDIQRTLEYLETQGVCVATFGPTKDFPAFYTRQSGHLAPYNVSSVNEAAELVHSLQQLKLESGILLAVPVPEADEHIKHEVMEQNIESALKSADECGMKGKAVTPFVLEKLAHLTEGISLNTNIALVKNNAVVGTQIAVELHKIMIAGREDRALALCSKYKTPIASPIVLGGSVVDFVINLTEPLKIEGCTLTGHITQCAGGVARNLADAIGKLGIFPKFVSAVGDDTFGKFVLESLSHVNCDGILISKDKATARYSAIIDSDGEFRMGVGDMDIHKSIVPEHVKQFLTESPMVIMDGNLPIDSIHLVLEFCQQKQIPVIFEPTDKAKAAVPFKTGLWKTLNLISPNLKELLAIASHLGMEVSEVTCETDTNTLLQEVVRLATPIAMHINTVLVTLGHLGVLVVGHEEPGGLVSARYYPATVLDSVVSASGAGDCVAAAVIAGKLTGLSEPECIANGFAAGFDSLNGVSAVPTKFKTISKQVECIVINRNVLRNNLYAL